MDVYASGQKLPDSPVFYKVYDASLIRITEAGSGVVGQPCQFKVDASQAVSTIFKRRALRGRSIFSILK